MATEEEKMMTDFVRGIRSKRRRERNFARNNEAYATIQERVNGTPREELGSDAPANETEYNKRFERGVYKKSDIPAYRRTARQQERYWAGQEANNTPEWQQRMAAQQEIADQKAESAKVTAKDGNGIQPNAPVPAPPKPIEQMTQQEFQEWMAQENQRQRTWNAAPEGTGTGTQPEANAPGTGAAGTPTGTGTGTGTGAGPGGETPGTGAAGEEYNDDNRVFDYFLSRLPENLRNGGSEYNMRRLWELSGKPVDFEEAKRMGLFTEESDGYYHAPTVAYNREKDEYEFLKAKDHPTIQKELDWYNSNDPKAVVFRQAWQLVEDENGYKYVRRPKNTTDDDDAADYAAKYDEAGKHYDETHKADKTFAETIGVDPAKQAAWDQRKEDNEKRRKQDALWKGLSLLADLGIAAAGGNVYKRTYKDSADYDRQRQLIEAEEAAAEQLAEKQRQTAMENYNKRRDTAAKAGADAWLKEKTQAEQNRWKAEQTKINIDARRELAEFKKEQKSQRTSSGSGSGSSGNGGDKGTYLDIPLGDGSAKKVRKPLVQRYANTFLRMVLGATIERDGKVLKLKTYLSKPEVGILTTTDDVNFKLATTGGIPNFMLNGAYPDILRDYIAAENLSILDEMYEGLLSSAPSNTANATSGRSQNGGSNSGNGGRQFSSGSGNGSGNGNRNSRVVTY